jgi:hypothetical protein
MMDKKETDLLTPFALCRGVAPVVPTEGNKGDQS